MSIRSLCAGVLLALLAFPAGAGEADVVAVEAKQDERGLWRFDVSVRHDDTGWEHFADKWDVLGPDGTILTTRFLMHPHETEQPFTRSVSGVAIPSDAGRVTIRAHCRVHGYGGREMAVELPR